MAKKTKVTRFSAILVLLFSLIAAAVVIIDNYVEALPLIGGYNPLEKFLDFSNFNIDLLTADWALTALAGGVVLSAIVAVLALIGVFAKRRLLRRALSLLAFAAILGSGVYAVIASGADILDYVKSLDYGYYAAVGASLLSFIFSLLGKKK
ncbi:MAG: hypothetical protein LBT30_02585 [Clostridiales bacterium]|jgi:hypothetical protein|nr:hypothetical protein [Clostridiales bacterium]